jgi:hypothetical protein
MAASLAMAPGRSDVVDDAAAISRSAVDKKATDVALVKKAANDTATAERAAVDKEATTVATTKKVADDAVVAERATAEVADRRAVEPKASGKSAEGSADSDSSPAPTVGAKRAAMPGGSTPPAKRPFRGSWKPRYVEGFRSCSSFFHLCILFHQDSSLCMVSSSSRTPSSGGALGIDRARDAAEVHDCSTTIVK